MVEMASGLSTGKEIQEPEATPKKVAGSQIQASKLTLEGMVGAQIQVLPVQPITLVSSTPHTAFSFHSPLTGMRILKV